MAEVYRARDVRLDRDVAIKLLRSDLARDPTFQARFRREAQSAAGLTHPMVVAVYDTGSDDRHEPPLPYIVMEYVDGRTLREVLQHDGRLTQRRAIEIIVDVCAALDYSHRAGIVHRDIKPGNVMITRDGSVKVMDFGIARAIAQSTSTITQTAAVMGTAQYLSPEQARGETVDSRSDLYSTGVMLYELLTGRPPFEGDSPVAVASQHVHEAAVPPSDRDPDLSADTDAVVMKSLAKNPANRYQTAAEMSDDLSRILAGRRVLATPLLREPSAARLTPAGQGPRRRWAILVALIAMLAAAAVAAGLLLSRDGASAVATVPVPGLAGKTLTAAEGQLRALGLAVGKTTGKISTRPVNTVLSSDPGPGTKLPKNSPVALTYSTGPGAAAIPNVIGQSQAAAERTLRALGFTTVTTPIDDPTKKAGTVTATAPPVGTVVDVLTVPVTLSVVSDQTTVPLLLGADLATAQDRLTTADLAVRVVQQDSPLPEGQVIAQDLEPGSHQPRGATVTITVSRQLTTPTPSPTPSRTPSPTPSPSAPPTPSTTPSLTPSPTLTPSP